jgi:diacylglycerol kinase family enzyme
MAEELCVIVNPSSGRGRASGRLERLRWQWGSRVAFWPTERAGHAEELALKAATQGFSVVAAAGGDGTVHEVANGLLRAQRPEVAFAVVPIGSANDYAFSLGLVPGGPPPQPDRWVDVGLVSDGQGRQRHFLCCLGLGFNGNVTLESRHIKRLQGMALYGLATLRALWYRYACPALSVSIDDQPPTTMPTLMLSVLLGRREGGFVMAPEAQLDDGLFDYVHTGDLSRWSVLYLLPRLAVAGPPRHHPKVHLGRCRRFVLQSPGPLIAHIDGEFFAVPQDNVRNLEIRLLPRALRVKMILPLAA